MKVLSLFDGMSCGMLALERAGIKVDQYYASEIDKYAIAVSQHNYPNIIQLGDVNNWREWDLGDIDLIIGGSPCQGFSFAGKQLAFDDPRSKLFFTMVDIINHYKPKYFLLENVKMKKEYQQIITDYMGVEPIEINSALVSAQNRKRLYRTNIPGVEQPADKGILLKDILEDEVDKSHYVDAPVKWSKSPRGARLGVIGKGGQGERIYGKAHQSNSIYGVANKSVALSALGGGRGAKTGLYAVAQKDSMVGIIQDYKDSKIVAMQVGQSDEHLIVPEATKKGYIQVRPGECFDYTVPKSKTRRGREMRVKSNCLTAARLDLMRYEGGLRIRKLTPIECERLQTVPDNYTLVSHPVYKGKMMSDSQRYKMLGNGRTVDVIAHIFKNI